MDDSGRVRFGKCIGNLDGVFQNVVQLQPTAWNHLAERLALDILHDDEVDAVLAANLVNRDDVGMIESRSCPRLLNEAALPAGIAGFVGWKDFDGNGPVQLAVTSLVNLSHPPSTQQGGDLVGTDLPSNQNSIRFFCHLFGHYLQRRGFNESLCFKPNLNVASRMNLDRVPLIVTDGFEFYKTGAVQCTGDRFHRKFSTSIRSPTEESTLL
jgi:hypothetical protein